MGTMADSPIPTMKSPVMTDRGCTKIIAMVSPSVATRPQATIRISGPSRNAIGVFITKDI